MAISKEIWNKARTLFESNQFSLSQISERTGIDKSSISKKAKIQQWSSVENLDYIEAKQTIASKKSTLPMEKINILDEVAEESIRNKKLISDNSTKLADKINKMADEVDNAQDIRHLVEANDKLSITMKVSDRHAPKSDVNLVNAQQNNSPTQINIVRDN